MRPLRRALVMSTLTVSVLAFSMAVNADHATRPHTRNIHAPPRDERADAPALSPAYPSAGRPESACSR